MKKYSNIEITGSINLTGSFSAPPDLILEATASNAVSSSFAVTASFATTANILTTRPTLEFRRSLLGSLPLTTDLPILWDQTVLNIGTLIGSRLSYNINDNNGRFTNISGRTLTVQVDFQGCAVSQNGSMNLVEHNLFIVKNTNRIATFCTLPVGALFAIGRVNSVITLAPNEFFICYQYVTATGSTTWQTSDAYFGYTQGHSTRLKVTEI
jgi:hypothetical protein